MSRERRLRALEVQSLRRLAADSGAPYGFTVDDILDEARQFFGLSLDAQLAEVDALAEELRTRAGVTDADLAHVRETLTRHDRPMD
jgi:hypothetical protein